MTSERWLSKRDIMRDLTVVSGGRTRFDDNCVVIGEQAPPRLSFNEVDPELLSKFSNHDKSKPDSLQGPDLAGITKMLRAVENYNQLSQKDAPKPVEAVTDKGNIVITISKLNPAAPEFKPKDCAIKNDNVKSQIDSTELNKENEKPKCDFQLGEQNEKATDSTTETLDNNLTVKNKISNSNNTVINNEKEKNVESNKENMIENNKTESCDPNQIGSKKDNKLNQREVLEKQKKELKDIVSGTINVSCVKIKKERNIAMTALMKLYSLPQKSTQEPVKCLPPVSSQEPVKVPSMSTQEFLPIQIQKPIKILPPIPIQEPVKMIPPIPPSIKLFPPAYYESSFKNKNKENNEDEAESLKHLDVPIAMDLVVLDDDYNSSNVPVNPVQNEIHHNDGKSSSKMSDKCVENTDNETIISHDIDRKDIEESVEKVNMWLNSVEGNGVMKENKNVVKKKEKPILSKAPFLGPVTFKRKQKKSQSPNSSGSRSETETNKTSASTGPSNTYVPSEYANELRKHYTEQAKAKKLATEDMWTRIENEMKEKEKNISAETVSADFVN